MSYSQFQTDVSIAVGVMSGLAVLYAILRTWSWFQRTGRLAVDFVTMVKFVVFLCGYVANAIFVVVLGASVWWEFFYKVISL
jgi:meckelin